MKRLLSLCGVLLMCGCAATGMRVGEDRLAAFVPGVTTYETATHLLGIPTYEKRAEDGSRLVQYAYTQTQTDPTCYVWIVGMFACKTTIESTTTTLMFDPLGRFLTYTQGQGTTHYGTGLIDGGKQR